MNALGDFIKNSIKIFKRTRFSIKNVNNKIKNNALFRDAEFELDINKNRKYLLSNP